MGVLVPRGPYARHAVRWIAALSLAGLCVTGVGATARAGDEPDPGAALDSAISAAEGGLQSGDLDGAERFYREALFEGWLLTATLERLDRRVPEAGDAVRNAALFGSGSRQGLRVLAAAQLQTGETAKAVATLEALAAKDAGDGESRRLLARALAADGQVAAAAQRLEEAEALAAVDAELAFLVGADYLWIKRIGDAERLFAQVARDRPIPQTRVLIGRAYRDAGEYDRARAELQAALRQDPGARRAH